MKFALAFLICSSAAFSQNAQISGLIQDPSSLNVVGAEISVRKEQTGGRRVTESNETGLYSVPSLSPGIYRISIHAKGFETVIREGVRLEAGDNVRLDFALHIGDSRTVITVKGGTPLMNTEDASIGTVISRDFIDQLPLNGRGIQTLVELTPGVVVVPVIPTSSGQWAINGQRSDTNYFTVDGVSVDFAAGIVLLICPTLLIRLAKPAAGPFQRTIYWERSAALSLRMRFRNFRFKLRPLRPSSAGHRERKLDW